MRRLMIVSLVFVLVCAACIGMAEQPADPTSTTTVPSGDYNQRPLPTIPKPTLLEAPLISQPEVISAAQQVARADARAEPLPVAPSFTG